MEILVRKNLLEYYINMFIAIPNTVTVGPFISSMFEALKVAKECETSRDLLNRAGATRNREFVQTVATIASTRHAIVHHNTDEIEERLCNLSKAIDKISLEGFVESFSMWFGDSIDIDLGFVYQTMKDFKYEFHPSLGTDLDYMLRVVGKR